MYRFPRPAGFQMNTKGRKQFLWNHQPTENWAGHCDKEECIHHVVQPRLVEELLKKSGSDWYQPCPVKNQVGNNSSTESQREPFVDGFPSEAARNAQKMMRSRARLVFFDMYNSLNDVYQITGLFLKFDAVNKPRRNCEKTESIEPFHAVSQLFHR